MDRRGCLSVSRQDDCVPGRPAAGDTRHTGRQPDAETAALAAYQRGAGQPVPGRSGSLSVAAYSIANSNPYILKELIVLPVVITLGDISLIPN